MKLVSWIVLVVGLVPPLWIAHVAYTAMAVEPPPRWYTELQREGRARRSFWQVLRSELGFGKTVRNADTAQRHDSYVIVESPFRIYPRFWAIVCVVAGAVMVVTGFMSLVHFPGAAA